MKASILSIGSEITDGYIVNSNAAYISNKLKSISVDTIYHSDIPDDKTLITSELRRLINQVHILIITGGLGPTADDLTREAIAEAYEIEYEIDNNLLSAFTERYAKLNIKAPVNNEKQFLYPKTDGFAIPNDVGVALGFVITKFAGKLIAVLPGVPREMFPMLDIVLTEIQKRFEVKEKVYESTLKCFGAYESVIDEKIRHICSPMFDPQGAIQAKDSIVVLRFKTHSTKEDEAKQHLKKVTDEIKQILGAIVFGQGEDELNKVVVGLLADSGLRIGIAESCTAGLISYELGKIPGVSSYFKQSVIAYSNVAKISRLNVPELWINEHGAVSPEVALAMAKGMLETSDNIDIAVSTTGIAGPGGATAIKPVGLVYVAIASKYKEGNEIVRRFHLRGGRNAIQQRAALCALNLLRLYLIDKLETPDLGTAP